MHNLLHQVQSYTRMKLTLDYFGNYVPTIVTEEIQS